MYHMALVYFPTHSYTLCCACFNSCTPTCILYIDISASKRDLGTYPGFPQALEIMENLENHKKVPCLEKSWNLKNPE